MPSLNAPRAGLAVTTGSRTLQVQIGRGEAHMDETERDIERSGTQARDEVANVGPGEGARVSRGEFLKLAGAAATTPLGTRR